VNRINNPAVFLAGLWLSSLAAFAAAARSPQEASQAAAKATGTIKMISGNSITLTTDAGSEVSITVQDGARLVRIAPGQTDLKNAAPIQPQDLQPGDRILVRGKLGDDGKSLMAASVIAMRKTDIAEKQARDRQEWQRHGVGGLVSSVDSSASTVTITTQAVGGKKDLAVHITKDTVLRRYAPDSIKFDDAKAAPLAEIHTGDQLRARGELSADGKDLTADEIVSGSFRNIAGTIQSIDAGAGTISVLDLATKKPVTIKITQESQLRKLMPTMAQRIAARLKGDSTEASSAAVAAPSQNSGQPGTGPNGSNGTGGSGRGGGAGDLQQALSRMPASTISDLTKGEAVMIVATQGSAATGVTAITLLSGVEPILEASPKEAASTILSPWSLNTGGAEAAAP
jgi:Domain of unknown function (DUF5666)